MMVMMVMMVTTTMAVLNLRPKTIVAQDCQTQKVTISLLQGGQLPSGLQRLPAAAARLTWPWRRVSPPARRKAPAMETMMRSML